MREPFDVVGVISKNVIDKFLLLVNQIKYFPLFVLSVMVLKLHR